MKYYLILTIFEKYNNINNTKYLQKSFSKNQLNNYKSITKYENTSQGGQPMARTDEPIKKLFKNKENFADLFNVTIFHGKQIIKPDKLTEINTEDIHIDSTNTKESEELNITQRHRDLRMQYDDQILQIVLGCEDQSSIDYAMSIRTMLYDALAYTKQQNDLELKQNKEGKFYRGKMTKNQKVLPVLSVVFYYGEQEWNAGKSLHDLIKWPENIDIKDIIPDYKMNLIWAYGMKEIDNFTTDLQYILYLLKYKQEEGKLEQYIEQNNDKLQHMKQDTHNAIIALMGSEILEGIEDERGEIRMESKALKAIQERGEKIGTERGIALSLIMLVQKKMQKNKQLPQIADELEEDEIKIQPIYQIIKENPQSTTEEIYQLMNKN